MHKELKTIFLFGPHDRFNYGDLLFPLMLEYAISKKVKCKFVFRKASIIDSDLTRSGAYKSISYKKLKKKIKSHDILIVTGGECLKAKWKILLSYLKWWYNEIVQRPKIFNIFKRLKIEKQLFGATNEFPYCIDRNDFPESIKIMYNSVGGGVSLDENQLKNVNSSDYIAVRDKRSFDFLRERVSKEVFMVPDSAIILSDVFPKEKITKSKEVLNLHTKEEKYIFFQVSKARVKNNIDSIVKELEDLSTKSLHKILLCPIGTALGHEDHVVLKQIFDKLNCKKVFIEKPSIHDILFLIIHAELYVGSSLHGAITAMSYGVPYLTLDKRQTKIKSYLESWSIGELSNMYEIDDFSKKALKLIEDRAYCKDAILEKSKIQKDLYYQSVDRMINLMR